MTEINIRADFVRSLHLLSVRSWLRSISTPVSARLMREGSVLEVTDCFIERSDIPLTEEGERAFGFLLALIVGNDPKDMSIEVEFAGGEIIEHPIQKIFAEDLSYALPKSLIGKTLSDADQIRVARGFLEIVVGNRAWLNYLRQHGLMRHILRNDHENLALDVKSSNRADSFIAELLSQIFSDRSLAERIDVGRLRAHALQILRPVEDPELAPPLSAAALVRELHSLVAEGKLDDETLNAFGEVVGLAARRGYIDALIEKQRPFRHNLLSAMTKQDDVSPFLRAATEGIESPLLTKALSQRHKVANFDDALTLSVLDDSALIDRMTANPNIVRRLVDEPRVTTLIADQPKIVSRVLSQTLVRATGTPPNVPLVSGNIVFSVVLGVYNGAEYLRATMDTILGQTYQDFELIAVDDQSNDETSDILAVYAALDARVKLFRHPVNLGQAAAMNTGVKHSTGQYVAFMDADDLWMPQKLAETAAFLTANPEVRFFQHNLYLMFGDVPSNKMFRATLASGDFIQSMQELGASLPGPFTPTAGLVFSRELLELIMPIPIALRTCSDGYLTRTAAALTPVVSYFKPLGFYRLHGDNATIGNPQYDVSVYAERVLTPAVQAFYDSLNIGIWLGSSSKRPDVQVLSINNRLDFGRPVPIDEKIRSAVAFVATGVSPPEPFSKTLYGFLVTCSLALENSEFTDLFQNVFARRGLNGDDDAVAAALECHMRMLVGDLAVAVRKLDVLTERVPNSTVVAAMRLQALGLRHEERHRLSNSLQTDISRGLMTDIHIDVIYSEYLKDHKPERYLQTQAALAQALNLNAAYFDNTRWISETCSTVDGWRDEVRSNGKSPKLFAARRLKPPPAVAAMIPVVGNPGHIDEDWDRVCSIDIAGATIFSGEWGIRSAEGMILVDLVSGTPHHRPSMYGNLGQTAHTANLVYPEKLREIGPCFVVGSDDNYFHWINDTIPRLFWYVQQEYPVEMNLLMGSIKRAYQRQTLAALEIKEEVCHFLNYPDVVRADRAVIPLISPQNRTFRPIYGPIRRAVHDIVAAKVTDSHSVNPWQPGEDGTKLFVRRAVSSHRSIINEVEIEALFTNAGWLIFDPIENSLAEQIAAFNSASVIVSSHGAALANLSFCRPATQVFELAFPDWSPPYFSTISRDRNLHHKTFFLRSVPSFTRNRSFNNGYCDRSIAERILKASNKKFRQISTITN